MTTKGWIVTAIVVPLIVGYILLNVEYSFFSIKGDAVESLSIKDKKIVADETELNIENKEKISYDSIESIDKTGFEKKVFRWITGKC